MDTIIDIDLIRVFYQSLLAMLCINDEISNIYLGIIMQCKCPRYHKISNANPRNKQTILLPQHNPRPPQHNNRIPRTNLSLPNTLRKLQKIPRLDMKNPQPRLLPNTIIQILHAQPLRRIIQHPPDLPILIEEEIPRRRLVCLRIARAHDMQVETAVSGDSRVTLRGALHVIDFCHSRGGAVGFRLGS